PAFVCRCPGRSVARTFGALLPAVAAPGASATRAEETGAGVAVGAEPAGRAAAGRADCGAATDGRAPGVTDGATFAGAAAAATARIRVVEAAPPARKRRTADMAGPAARVVPKGRIRK